MSDRRICEARDHNYSPQRVGRMLPVRDRPDRVSALRWPQDIGGGLHFGERMNIIAAKLSTGAVASSRSISSLESTS
jgi:hypothetical protein